MNTQYKPGYEKISEHIKRLESQNWLTQTQKKWPRYLFHFSELSNVAAILTEGAILSREKISQTGKRVIDIASSDIIEHTPQGWKNFVRLYFRPRTPTQYINEGIRSKEEIKLGAHCPVPVVLLFDAFKLLALKSTYVSNGNLRVEGVKFDNSVYFYLSLPFDIIYDDKGFSRLTDSEKNRVKFHRHAEVLIPDSLDLSNLRYIVCRSYAERQTLFHLLPDTIRRKWEGKTYVDEKASLFFCQWVYIASVDLSSEKIVFHFNQSSQKCFQARVEIIECQTNEQYYWEVEDFSPPVDLKLTLSSIKHPECYMVSFFLDGHLAFKGVHREESGIF